MAQSRQVTLVTQKFQKVPIISVTFVKKNIFRETGYGDTKRHAILQC